MRRATMLDESRDYVGNRTSFDHRKDSPAAVRDIDARNGRITMTGADGQELVRPVSECEQTVFRSLFCRSVQHSGAMPSVKSLRTPFP